MTDKPADYYQTWANKLNEAIPGLALTPHDVAEFERQSGKPIAEMSPEDFGNAALVSQAEAVVVKADADQSAEDANIIIAGMDRRPGVRTTEELIQRMSPDDDDFGELYAALHRMAWRVRHGQ